MWSNVTTVQHLLENPDSFPSTAMIHIQRYHDVPREHILGQQASECGAGIRQVTTFTIHLYHKIRQERVLFAAGIDETGMNAATMRPRLALPTMAEGGGIVRSGERGSRSVG
jgi:hypothetical protein